MHLRSIVEFHFKEENKVAGAKYEQRLSRFPFHCTVSERSVGNSSGSLHFLFSPGRLRDSAQPMTFQNSNCVTDLIDKLCAWTQKSL